MLVRKLCQAKRHGFEPQVYPWLFIVKIYLSKIKTRTTPSEWHRSQHNSGSNWPWTTRATYTDSKDPNRIHEKTAETPLFRKSHEDLRATLHVKVTEVRSLSWNLTTQLCGGKTNPMSLREAESKIESDRKQPSRNPGPWGSRDNGSLRSSLPDKS